MNGESHVNKHGKSNLWTLGVWHMGVRGPFKGGRVIKV